MRLYSALEQVEATDNQGRLYVIPPGKVVEVPETMGQFFKNHFAYTGIVEVSSTQDDTGIKFDMEGAKINSDEALKKFDENRWQRWVSDMVEDYVKRNKPVPPPPPAILALMKRRGYDPKTVGIVPLGWEDPSKELAKAQAANVSLQEQINKLSAQLETVLRMQGGKPQEVAPQEEPTDGEPTEQKTRRGRQS